ncbi:MAG: hypothetical protein M3R13_01245 [Armatimonadota bacterium]|nr:hypothetical protein [Armatimonadota bacterium]
MKLKIDRRTILISSIALAGLVFGTGLGLTQEGPEPECFVASNMYSPCAGFQEYSCPTGCTEVLTGVERSNCGGPTMSGHCCQWIERTLQCVGGSCTGCPAEVKPVEYTLARYGWSCLPFGGGTDKVCQPQDG